MKLRPLPPSLTRRAALLAALACLIPGHASADSTVFKTTFDGDSLQENPLVTITPTATNWYILSSKNATTSSLTHIPTGSFIDLLHAASSAANVQGVARFTTSPIALSAIGDSITARATIATDKVLNLACGLYESGGVNPLITLNNSGLNSTAIAAATQGGTLGWKGYRARLESANAAGNIAARPAQTGANLTQQAHDLVAPSTIDFNSPGPISIGSVPASTNAAPVTDGFAPFHLTYRIVRTAADALTITYTIADTSDTIIYSVTGTTTNAGTLPSQVTSSFDGFAIGVRNNASAGPSADLNISELTITATNSAIARIVNQPINQTWVTGQSSSISVNAAGTAPLSYQWYKGTDAISGATAATYTIPSASAGDAGDYHVVVTNAFGFETSATVTASVVGSPAAPTSVVATPSAQTVNEGETLTLSATASGAPTPSYQWYKGTTPISGAIYSTYTIASTVASTAGTYHVVATNGSGSVPSNDATVTINSQAPAITTPPANATLNVGQAIVLSVIASGYPAPTYQWYKGSTAITGATGSSYTVASATTADNGTYHVVATNLYDSATSADATVTVNVVAPAVTTDPSNTTVALGQSASFTVVASGSAPLTYQWYKGTDPISGATSATYTIPTTTGSSAGDYHVVVNNESGIPATSANATLSLIVTENTKPFETTFATDTIHATEPHITPTSTNWYVISTKTAIASNITGNVYSLTLNQGTTAGNYQTAALFTETPLSLSAVGSSVSVTFTFTPSNVLNLGIGLFNSGGSLPHTIHNDGSTTALAPNLIGGKDGVFGGVLGGTQNWTGYRGLLSNNATSGAVFHRLAQNNPTPTSNRSQDLVTNGSASTNYGDPVGASIGTLTNSGAAISFTNDQVYTIVYQIARNAADQYTIGYKLYTGPASTISPATQIFSSSGVTTAAATVPSAVTSSFDSFAIGGRTTNGGIPKIALSKVTVNYSYPVTAITPSITTQPSSVTVAVGAPFTLTAAATGSPTPTYQWYKGTSPSGILISGATAASYHVDAAVSGDTGSYYVVATNAVGAATSNAATVTVGSASTPYQTWASSQGLTVGVNDGATQDPDNDGLSNLIEFALGGNPLSASPTIVPVLNRSGNNVTFTYDVQVAATAQFSVGAEYTTDLATSWTTAVNGVGGVSISTTPVNSSTDHVVVTVPASGAKIFVRLRVQPLP